MRPTAAAHQSRLPRRAVTRTRRWGANSSSDQGLRRSQAVLRDRVARGWCPPMRLRLPSIPRRSTTRAMVATPTTCEAEVDITGQKAELGKPERARRRSKPAGRAEMDFGF